MHFYVCETWQHEMEFAPEITSNHDATLDFGIYSKSISGFPKSESVDSGSWAVRNRFRRFRNLKPNPSSYENPEGKKFCPKIFFLEATNPLLCKIFLALKHEHDLTQNLQKLFEESSFFFAFDTKLTPHRKISYTTTPVLKSVGKRSTWFSTWELVEHLCFYKIFE